LFPNSATAEPTTFNLSAAWPNADLNPELNAAPIVTKTLASATCPILLTPFNKCVQIRFKRIQVSVQRVQEVTNVIHTGQVFRVQFYQYRELLPPPCHLAFGLLYQGL
jgi:hypothetical protein